MEGATFGLQSGFVLAVIIGVVLLAPRLGGTEDVARRLFQVALGVLLAFAVVSMTSAFLRGPDREEIELAGEGDDDEEYELLEDVSNRNTGASAVHAGAGVIGLVLGLSQLRRLNTLPLAVILGGLLLLVFGGVSGGGEGTDPTTAFFALYSSLLTGQSSIAVDIAHFVVVAGGALALLAYGYATWEQPRVPQPVDVPED